MKKAALFLIVCILTFSCKEKLNQPIELKQNKLQNARLSQKEKEIDLKNIARIFAKCVKENKSLRKQIKAEVNKKFDGDFDMLFSDLYTLELDNGQNFKEYLNNIAKSKNFVDKIEENLSTLSVLVPELPNGSFDNNIWNAENQIPFIGIKIKDSNDVPMFNSDGKEQILPGYITPGFPIIILKENERLISEDDQNYNNYKTRELKKSSSVKKVKFIDDNFDGEKIKQRKLRTAFSFELGQKLKDSYDIYLNADGWQRDYVYYSISPNQTKGPFSNEYKDGLTSFTMIGDPMTAYNKIAQNGTGDPLIIGGYWGSANSSQWTGGYFDFKVTLQINAKNGPGATLTTAFGASGNQLFNLTYQNVTGNWWGDNFYILTNVSLKKMPLNIPILNWDLDNYSKAIKISIEEFDNSATTTITEQISQKFATNFGYDAGFGDKVKIGLKFGGSSETTNTNTFQRVITTGSNQLGDVIVDFADNPLISKSSILGINYYSTREYNTGYYSISFEPIKVQ